MGHALGTVQPKIDRYHIFLTPCIDCRPAKERSSPVSFRPHSTGNHELPATENKRNWALSEQARRLLELSRSVTQEVRALVESALQLVLPRRCTSCDCALEIPAAFCPPCELTIERVTHPCPRCGHPDGCPTCPQCQKGSPPFSRSVTPYLYGGALGNAIVRLKFHRLAHLAGPLGSLLADATVELLTCSRDEPRRCVVPVPLHRHRLRQRGFNQAALLARQLCRKTGWELSCGALQRNRDTAPQSLQSGLVSRQHNVQGAFSARSRQIAGRNIVLVDDVLTTGATAIACTNALVHAGARQVIIVTLARAGLVVGRKD